MYVHVANEAVLSHGDAPRWMLEIMGSCRHGFALQLFPSPLYPTLHTQLYEPAVLAQAAFESQASGSLHSSMSVSQWSPMKPVFSQLQVYEVTPLSVQAPLFRHGVLAQSSISAVQQQ